MFIYFSLNTSIMFLHTNMPYTFAGIKKPLEKCKAVVIPVPYDATTSFNAGARNGPRAIINTSRFMEDYDIELGCEIGNELGFYTTEEIEPDTNSPLGMIGRVQNAVETVLEKKKFPIVLGGEHSITLGFVRALEKYYNQFSVLQIDAHADLRNEYGNSLYSHACVMRRIREKVKNVLQIGIRSYSQEEADYIKKMKISDFIYDKNFDIKKILSQLSENVFITIDLDGLDPDIMPAVGTPEPGGLEWGQTLELLHVVAKNKKILGFDIVELAPIPGNIASEALAAKLVLKLAGYSLLECILK